MTTAMRLQEDGIQKGIRKGKIEDAKKMIQKGYSTTALATAHNPISRKAE